MTRISKPKRSGVGAKRLDLTDLRELLRDRRVWSAVGRVVQPEGGALHWQIVQHEGEDADIEIEVVIQPSQVPVTARLRGGGWWEVPAVDDEVALLVPDGQLDFMPIVIGSLSSNRVPSGDQAPSPTNIVIAAPAGGKVYVHDGSSGAKSLATADHFHLDSTGSPTGAPITSAVPNAPNPNFPVPDAVHPFLDETLTPTTHPFHDGDSDGTAVLYGK